MYKRILEITSQILIGPKDFYDDIEVNPMFNVTFMIWINKMDSNDKSFYYLFDTF